MQDIAIIEYKKVDYHEQYIKALSLGSLLSEVGNNLPLITQNNFSIEEVRLGLDMKLARMGHTERISHSG